MCISKILTDNNDIIKTISFIKLSNNFMSKNNFAFFISITCKIEYYILK